MNRATRTILISAVLALVTMLGLAVREDRALRREAAEVHTFRQVLDFARRHSSGDYTTIAGPGKSYIVWVSLMPMVSREFRWIGYDELMFESAVVFRWR
jgi:hypothetical protein